MNNKICKKTSIGGQALIEGILMRGPEKVSIAVRKPDNVIEVKTEEIEPSKFKNIRKLPIIRGIFILIESLSMGMDALMYSASFFEDEEDLEKESITSKVFGKYSEKAENIITMLISFALALLFFFFLPTWLTSLFKNKVNSSIGMNFIEGIIRLIIFFIYIIMIAKMEDIKRVFMYHGAEHKTIFCYENGDELTVENIKKYSILHPRCGTSFLFTVMLVSILVLSLFGWPNPFMRMVTRLISLPIIVGVSYEINRLIGKSNSKFAEILSKPGLFVQKVATVKEPTDDMIEVAIAAMKEVIPEDPKADIW